MTDDLRARIAEALRSAAHDCDGDCGLSEEDCRRESRVVVSALTWGKVSNIEGDVEAITDAVLAAVQPIADELRRANADRAELTDQLSSANDDLDIADQHIERGNEQTDSDQPSEIAHRIRAELVCRDLYGRVNDGHELTFKQAAKSRDWHDLCYWGEASARIAEGRCPGYETSPNICRCPCDGCKNSCGTHREPATSTEDG